MKATEKNSFLRVVTLMAVCLVGPELLYAQTVPDDFPFQPGNARGLGAIRIVNQFIDQDAETETLDGASLKTDPDLEATLEQANRFKEEQQFGVATRLWQTVLERAGDALYSSDDQTYFSLVQQVENIIASLPADGGLRTYRVTADAQAKEILAAANDPLDADALSQIVRRFFLSSLGDDAALTLSSVYMDQYDFVGAYRLLQKIVDIYPDPSVSMAEVHTRIALCQAFFGEIKEAEISIQNALEIPDRSNEPLLRLVAGSIDSIAGNRVVSNDSNGYPLLLASRNRYGVMPNLPGNALSNDLIPCWQYYFAVQNNYRWSDIKKIKALIGDEALDAAQDTLARNEEQMIELWKQNGWRPAGHLLIYGDNIYFKTALDVAVWNIAATDTDPRWRPVWRNRFIMDDYTTVLLRYRANWDRRSRGKSSMGSDPTSNDTVQLFSDQIASQMSIQNGIFYSIEGPPIDDNLPSESGLQIVPQWNAQPRRSRSNRLSAYDANSGRILWTLPRADQRLQKTNMPSEEVEETPWLSSGGFMAAPIHFNSMAIVPVNQGGAISVYALDPQKQGKTIWKSFLCDEPEGGSNPYAPINISLDGSDLFVSCGLGVVFVMDPSNGMVRFAKRYSRQGTPNQMLRQFGQNVNRMDYDGWSSDTIIPYGRQMICFCSDSQFIDAYDRKDGNLIWRSEMNALGYKIDYLLGVYGDTLYAAGSETLIAFDLRGEGRMIWGGDQLFGGEKSYGRGMLTSDGIYLPAGNRIIKYDLQGDMAKPRVLAEANVDFGTDAPVGNLYSDGQKIWVHGANRVYALALDNRKKAKKSDEEQNNED